MFPESAPAGDRPGAERGGNIALADDDSITIRIVARRISDGRIEFGARTSDGAVFRPDARYFPATGPNHDRWLRSGEIDFGDGFTGRVIARRVSDGRVEFGFRVEDREDILPRARFFPASGPNHRRWLGSTEIQIPRRMSIAEERPMHDADSSVSTNDKQRALADALFKFGADLAYDYNGYGNCPNTEHAHGNVTHSGSWCGDGTHPAVPGYDGGHSGWDAYRSSDGHRAHAFHSLTSGTITCLQDDYGLIAVEDHRGYVTRYLHGQRGQGLYVGKPVNQHDPIGITAGLGRGGRTEFLAHVHVEVAAPGTDPCDPSDGAADTGSVDPIDYLYDALDGA